MNMAKASTHDPRLGARSVSRKLALQAMYRVQVNEGPWQDLITEFSTAEDMPRADREYFDELIRGIATGAGPHHGVLDRRGHAPGRPRILR